MKCTTIAGMLAVSLLSGCAKNAPEATTNNTSSSQNTKTTTAATVTAAA